MPEPEDFDDFVLACSSRLYRGRLPSHGGDRSQAEDLVADALARVYLAWPGPGSGPATRSAMPGARWPTCTSTGGGRCGENRRR
jgi:hypothetical protein